MFSFLNTSKVEYLDKDNNAVCDYKVTLFSIPIYRSRVNTCNTSIVKSLTKTEVEPIKKIKGFKNEIKD